MLTAIYYLLRGKTEKTRQEIEQLSIGQLFLKARTMT